MNELVHSARAQSGLQNLEDRLTSVDVRNQLRFAYERNNRSDRTHGRLQRRGRGRRGRLRFRRTLRSVHSLFEEDNTRVHQVTHRATTIQQSEGNRPRVDVRSHKHRSLQARVKELNEAEFKGGHQ